MGGKGNKQSGFESMGLEAHVGSLSFHLCLNGISGDRAQKSCERIPNTPCVAGPVRGQENGANFGLHVTQMAIKRLSFSDTQSDGSYGRQNTEMERTANFSIL